MLRIYCCCCCCCCFWLLLDDEADILLFFGVHRIRSISRSYIFQKVLSSHHHHSLWFQKWSMVWDGQRWIKWEIQLKSSSSSSSSYNNNNNTQTHLCRYGTNLKMNSCENAKGSLMLCAWSETKSNGLLHANWKCWWIEYKICVEIIITNKYDGP